MDKFMEAIETRRITAGLTRKMLAKALGVTPQAYWQYTKSSRSPDKVVARHWAEYCEKNPEIMEDFVDSFFNSMIDEYARQQHDQIEKWRKSA